MRTSSEWIHVSMCEIGTWCCLSLAVILFSPCLSMLPCYEVHVLRWSFVNIVFVEIHGCVLSSGPCMGVLW